MGDVARLVGKEVRVYQKEGRQQRYCGLHLLYVEGTYPDVEGSKVEAVSCPRSVDPDALVVGHLYELGYQIYTMKGQRMARLDRLDPVEG